MHALTDLAQRSLTTFIDGYIECALWSSIGDDDQPLDDAYGAEDFSPSALASIQEDCAAFLAAHWEDIGDCLERAGHDFWLTRNRHGAGFWDGDWPEDIGRRLTDAAHVYGTVDITIGEDGLLYV